MSEEKGSFLSRWSRRKIEVQREEAPPEPPARVDEVAQEAAEHDAEPELTPEEVAALPKPEELTAEADFSVFLRKGVPEALKKAALRRMWVLDPAIRDHVGDARDYAYDWNVPGGVPGNGPLLPGDNVAAMLNRLFGDPSKTASAEEAANPLEGGEITAARVEHDEAEVEELETGSDNLRSLQSHASSSEGVAELPSASAPEAEPVRSIAPTPPRRRHGGAKPA